MMTKKNSRYDLESKRIAFFQLGLFVTGSVTLAAFTYSNPMLRADIGKNVPREIVSISWDNSESQKDKPKMDISVPLDRKQKNSAFLGEKEPDEKSGKSGNTIVPIDPKVGVGNGGFFVDSNGGFGTEIIPIVPEDILENVDKEASFVGGFNELTKYIFSNINYPQEAIEFNEQGKVYLSFVVEKDGSISNIVVERGVSNTLDREAKRIVNSFPNWVAGEIKMQKVRTRVRLPINFVLSN